MADQILAQTLRLRQDAGKRMKIGMAATPIRSGTFIDS